MKQKIAYWIIGLGVGLFFAFLNWEGIFSGPKNFFEDLLFSPRPAGNEIIIVAIDNESLAKVGQWPWPRQVFAQALGRLKEAPPAAIALDIIFAEPSRAGAADDDALAVAMNEASFPVVLAGEANNLFLPGDAERPWADFFVEPLNKFKSSRQVTLGLANIVLDKDGVVRRLPLEARSRQSGLSARTLAYETVLRSGRPIPDAGSLEAVNRLVFAGPPGIFRTIPFWRIFENDKSAIDSLAGKIVILGATASDLHDSQLTPLDRGQEMSGAEIQANAMAMLLSGWRLREAGRAVDGFLILLAALLPAIFFSRFGRLRWVIFWSAVVGVFYLVAAIVLFERGWVINLLHALLAWFFAAGMALAFRHFVAEKERRHLKSVFSKYVSREVVGEILKNKEKIRLGGEEREITVLFSDIRGFTSLSEKTPPVKLVKILNRYFTAMTEEIQKRRGVVDKYIGDAIMAFWGAPLDEPGQADLAIEAALGMLKRLERLNEELKKEGEPEIKIGIGLYFGPAMVGNIGSEERLNYTAMGDTVNVASRLEGLNKEYGTRLIVGASVKDKAQTSRDYLFLGEVLVKGRAEPVKIYEVVR